MNDKADKNAKRRASYQQKKGANNALANARTIDAFISQTTGAGVTGVDKFASFTFGEGATLDSATLEALYVHNDIAATIVERVVNDALREGYSLGWEGATEGEIKAAIDWAESKYGVTDIVRKARIYARLFGGGAVFLGVDGDPEKPAILGRAVDFIRAVPSTELDAATWYADPTEQDYGTPAQYRWTINHFAPVQARKKEANKVSVMVDESRTIPMYGILTTERRFIERRGWGDSVLQRVYDVLKKFEASFDSVLHTLAENSVPVYKVEGLLKMLQSNNADLLTARFQLLNAGKSAYRAVVLGETESFERVEAGLSEAANVSEVAMLRVATTAQMPATILFGRAPAGMNATGESDLENWHQQVRAEQSLVLAKTLRELYSWLLAQSDSPLEGVVPEDLSVTFPPLWTPSLQDQVNLYAQTAGADTAYINAGVLKSEEVAIHRAQQGGQFPKVDLATREASVLESPESLVNTPEPEPVDEPATSDN